MKPETIQHVETAARNRDLARALINQGSGMGLRTCRGGHGGASCWAPLDGLVSAYSTPARPGPAVLCPLPGGQHRQDVLVRASLNALKQMVFYGMFGYLAAYLMQTYQLPAGETALPLALSGVGIIVAGILGGRVADHRRRLAWFAMSCWCSGLLAALVFTTWQSPWATVALACGASGLARISSAVAPTLLLELAGSSRTTATGLFAVSNQVGAFGGAGVGGFMLALGGFTWVGLFCLGVSVIAAMVIQFKVRDSAVFLEQLALRQSATTTA